MSNQIYFTKGYINIPVNRCTTGYKYIHTTIPPDAWQDAIWFLEKSIVESIIDLFLFSKSLVVTYTFEQIYIAVGDSIVNYIWEVTSGNFEQDCENGYYIEACVNNEFEENYEMIAGYIEYLTSFHYNQIKCLLYMIPEDSITYINVDHSANCDTWWIYAEPINNVFG